MKKRNVSRMPAFFLCVVLIAAMALTCTGCKAKNEQAAPVGDAEQLGGGPIGEGETGFTFIVADAEGNETEFQVSTDETIVGEALQALGLIEGDEGEYGLYVKTVNGITADYDKDGTYWAFYIDGEYGMTGVDVTEITAGAEYAFRVEK